MTANVWIGDSSDLCPRIPCWTKAEQFFILMRFEWNCMKNNNSIKYFTNLSIGHFCSEYPNNVHALQPTKKYPYLPMPFKWISIKTIPLWNCSVVGIHHSITITITIITSTLARPRSVQLSSSTCTLCTVFVVDWMCVLKWEPNTIYLH